MLIECPSCRTRVWISKNGQCPACRKLVPEQMLHQAAADSDIDSTPTSSVKSTDIQGESTLATTIARVSAPALVSTSAERADTTRGVVRRTHWGSILGGLFLILIGGLLLAMPTDENGLHSTSRRVRAAERTIGADRTAMLSGFVLVGVGGWLIFASRREMLEEETPEAGTKTCDLCSQSSSGTREAFITLGGRPAQKATSLTSQPTPHVFRCLACDDCVQKSQPLFRAHVFQVILFIAASIVVPLALLALALLFSPPKDFKSGAEIIIIGFCGFALLLITSAGLLYRYLAHETSRLLGARLDPIIRKYVGIRGWGWPRFVTISRTVSPNFPVVDPAHL